MAGVDTHVSANLSSASTNRVNAQADTDTKVHSLVLSISDEEVHKHKQFIVHLHPPHLADTSREPLILGFDRNDYSIVYVKNDICYEETLLFSVESELGDVLIVPRSFRTIRTNGAEPSRTLPLIITNFHNKSPNELDGSYLVAKSNHFFGKVQIRKFGKTLSSSSGDRGLEIIDLEDDKVQTNTNGYDLTNSAEIPTNETENAKKRKFTILSCTHVDEKASVRGYCDACYEKAQKVKLSKSGETTFDSSPQSPSSPQAQGTRSPEVQQVLQDSTKTPPTPQTPQAPHIPRLSSQQLQQLLRNQILLQEQLGLATQQLAHPHLTATQKANLTVTIKNIQMQLVQYTQVLRQQWQYMVPEGGASSQSIQAAQTAQAAQIAQTAKDTQAVQAYPSPTQPPSPQSPTQATQATPQPQPAQPTLPAQSPTQSMQPQPQQPTQPTEAGSLTQQVANAQQRVLQQSNSKGPDLLSRYIAQETRQAAQLAAQHAAQQSAQLSTQPTQTAQQTAQQAALLQAAQRAAQAAAQPIVKPPGQLQFHTHVPNAKKDSPTQAQIQAQQAKMIAYSQALVKTDEARKFLDSTKGNGTLLEQFRRHMKSDPTSDPTVRSVQLGMTQEQLEIAQHAIRNSFRGGGTQSTKQAAKQILAQSPPSHSQSTTQTTGPIQYQHAASQSQTPIKHSKRQKTAQQSQPQQQQHQQQQPVFTLTLNQLQQEVQSQTQSRAFQYCHMKVLQHQMFLQQHIQHQVERLFKTSQTPPPPSTSPTSSSTPPSTSPSTIPTTALAAALTSALSQTGHSTSTATSTTPTCSEPITPTDSTSKIAKKEPSAELPKDQESTQPTKPVESTTEQTKPETESTKPAIQSTRNATNEVTMSDATSTDIAKDVTMSDTTTTEPPKEPTKETIKDHATESPKDQTAEPTTEPKTEPKTILKTELKTEPKTESTKESTTRETTAKEATTKETTTKEKETTTKEKETTKDIPKPRTPPTETKPPKITINIKLKSTPSVGSPEKPTSTLSLKSSLTSTPPTSASSPSPTSASSPSPTTPSSPPPSTSPSTSAAMPSTSTSSTQSTDIPSSKITDSQSQIASQISTSDSEAPQTTNIKTTISHPSTPPSTSTTPKTKSPETKSPETTSSQSTNSQPTNSSQSTNSQPTNPSQSTNSQPTNPSPSTNSQPTNSSQSTNSQPTSRYAVDAWTMKVVNCQELQWLKHTIDFYRYTENK